MTVPTYDHFIEPLLRFLAEHRDGAAIADVYESLATRMKLGPEDRLELLPSRSQPLFKNRIGWAQDRLKRASLSESPRRGFWRLTTEGLKLAAKYKTLPEAEVERIWNVDRSSRLKPSKGGSAEPSSAPELPVSEVTTGPEERIDAALAEMRDSVARDLLENIGNAPPEFFEKLVLELLHAMGYGTSRSDLQRVGGSGDGGIDGIISLDKLGLEKVYVQAKRWKNTVGSPEIQGFMGALQLQNASKGVFITTSTFTKDAKQAAAKARGSIVLVDGERLSNLMMDHGVGVSHKAFRLPKVDNDYFEEG
jgi:restriction system protein